MHFEGNFGDAYERSKSRKKIFQGFSLKVSVLGGTLEVDRANVGRVEGREKINLLYVTFFPFQIYFCFTNN